MSKRRPLAAQAPPFVFTGGVRVADTPIWCDARRAQALCFLSRARPGGASQLKRHAKLVMTERTLQLLAAGRRGASAEVLVTPFARPFSLGRLRLELLPSGRLPGAAQLLVDVGGRRLLYGGEVNPRPGRAAEPAQVRACEALVLDAPLLSLSAAALPPRAEVEGALLEAVRAALAAGVVPVVVAAPFGAAEEAALMLQASGVQLRAHPRLAAHLDVYARMGLSAPGSVVRRFDGRVRPGEALLWPLAPPLALGAKHRRFLVGDEALDPRAAAPFDAAFALADHGDLPSLLEHALACEARSVYFTRGLTERVAAAFVARGLTVHPLGPPEQMALFDAARPSVA